MLIISLIAIIIGTVLLYLETAEYGSPPYKGGPMVLRQAAPPAHTFAIGGPAPRAGAPAALFAANL